MKFLADMGVSLQTVQALCTNGHDTVHVRDEGLQRLSDAKILEKAANEFRIVLTFDLDFGDILAAAPRTLPSVIVFRLRNQSPAAVTPKLLQVLTEARKELEAGALIVIEENRYRVRRLPIRS